MRIRFHFRINFFNEALSLTLFKCNVVPVIADSRARGLLRKNEYCICVFVGYVIIAKRQRVCLFSMPHTETYILLEVDGEVHTFKSKHKYSFQLCFFLFGSIKINKATFANLN